VVILKSSSFTNVLISGWTTYKFMSKVALEGMQFYAFHGFYEEEQLIGAHFVVDVYVEANIMGAAQMDDLGGTVNYETIYFICKMEMKKTSKLIEHVAQRILNKLQEVLSNAGSITVRVSKLHPPLGGAVDRSFVEVSSGGGSMDAGFGGGKGEEEDFGDFPFGNFPF